MIVYPAIDLMGGRWVSLRRGGFDKPLVHEADPVETAVDFARRGAEWLHLSDLDRVRGAGDNSGLIRRIIREAPARVQVGGGVRLMSHVERWIGEGAARVVIATAAYSSPRFVREAAYRHPDQVVVAVDVAGGRVVVSGWTQETAFNPAGFVRQFDGDPLAAFLLTDVDREADAPLLGLAEAVEVAGALRTPVIASGLVRSLDDLSRLAYMPNIAGALCGRALFAGAFTLEQALQVAREATEPVAEFL